MSREIVVIQATGPREPAERLFKQLEGNLKYTYWCSLTLTSLNENVHLVSFKFSTSKYYEKVIFGNILKSL